MKYFVLLLFVLFTFAACQNQPDKNENNAANIEKPNIIFIMVDDLGYADLGAYGGELINTNNIDQLAAEGIRFTQAYAGAPVCAPSRSVLMTGQHTGHTTVRGNFAKVGGTPPQGRLPLQPKDVTVAEVLKQGGYVTGITGKWGLGEPRTSGIPNNQGFDQWFGYLNQRHAHTYYPKYVWHNQDSVVLKGNLEGKDETYVHDLFTDFALQFIENNSDTTFFLYLPYTIPHSDLVVPSLGEYADKDWEEKEKIYAAMVTRMDRDIGKIVQLLQDEGIEENTMIFFCSDNGAASRWEGRFNSSGRLRGYKRDLYEGGIRTPMIVKYPPKIPKGAIDSTNYWYFADVLPTLADVAGVPIPENINGVSVKSIIYGNDQPELLDRFLYWEFYEKGFQQAVRWKQWKAIKLAPGKEWLLYNLVEDLAEQKNIANEHPQVLDTIISYVDTARVMSPHWPVMLN